MQLVINIISQTCYSAHEHTNMLLCTWRQNMLLCTWTHKHVTLHMNTQTCYSAHEHTTMLLCTWTIMQAFSHVQWSTFMPSSTPKESTRMKMTTNKRK